MKTTQPNAGSAALFAKQFAIIAFGVAATIASSLFSGHAAAKDPAAKDRAEWKQEYVRPDSVPFPEDNPYTAEKAQLGHQLFFDPRLSGADYISCATCHNPSFSWGDGLPTGFGHKMTRLGRRTPTILNLAWGELMMWDGRFESLEQQALGPMGSPAEMNQEMDDIVAELGAIPGYRTMFNIAFPGQGITVENVAKAIATFERTVVSGIAPFDRWIAGDEAAISTSAKRGFDLFNGKANCVACHSGWNFTDDSFHDIGLPDEDIGRGNVMKKNVKMQHAFKTPTLRNATKRGPYMHDGSVSNLKAVMEHYDKGGIKRPSLSNEMKPLNLTGQEIAYLMTFLRTLDGDDPVIAIPYLPANTESTEAALSRKSPAAGPGSGGNSETCLPSVLHWRRCGR